MYEVAIIGFGGMGSYHAKQILSIPEEFHIAGAYDINPEKTAIARGKGIRG